MFYTWFMDAQTISNYIDFVVGGVWGNDWSCRKSECYFLARLLMIIGSMEHTFQHENIMLK
jgi:hypothetical protein